MTEKITWTNRDHQSEPTGSEQSVQQAPQNQADLSDSQMQMSQAGSSAKLTAPGRKPLFRS
jgi:hypothetical protein